MNRVKMELDKDLPLLVFDNCFITDLVISGISACLGFVA